MKILLTIILLVVGLIVGFYFFQQEETTTIINQEIPDDSIPGFEDITQEEIRACSIDSDCVEVLSYGCCGCPYAINKNFLDDWNRQEKDTDCSGELCGPCGPSQYKEIKCLNNACSVYYASEQ
jgi:hypothetical protein